jgi:N-acetylmuramoyl-L-alanine amidase
VIDFYGESRSTASIRTANGKRAPREQAKQTASTDIAGAPGKTADETLPAAPASPAAKAAIIGPPSPETEAGAERVAAENSTLAPGVKSRSKPAKSAMMKPDLIQPSLPAQPTRDGQATLTRTLGLKISRIVIDAGHGGHDTGTIGPSGLMEKGLCLDVALRLGKIIQQRLPAAEVVYTRADDTFIPLEDRTRVANAARADLFISIHANSSRDHAARGVETYYLNLKGSADSMEVAARENATSQQSVHDLEDVVKRIARSEKIEESREFAADVQESLAKRILRTSRKEKDRGVRKAPFVVLIGADMPSILTEISFLSNPADEKLLKKPNHRQRVAEGLYQGMASYLQNLNSVTLNMPVKSSGHPAAAASVEQSRSQQ